MQELSNLQDVGAALKERRESQGLEREDIAMRIKISAKKLLAIEEGRAEELPQPIFTRGFIRSYAQVLGMEKSDIDKLMEAAFPPQAFNNINAHLTADAREQSVGLSTPLVPRKFFRLLGLLLIMCVLGGGAWLYFSGNMFMPGARTGQPAEAEPTPQIAGEAQAADGASRAPADVSMGGAPAGAPTGAPGDASGTPAPANAARAPEAGTPSPAAPENSTAQAIMPVASGSQILVPPAPRLNSGLNQVQLNVATGRSWVKAQADNDPAREFELKAGGHYRLEFKKKADVVLGNAVRVQVTYNGKKVPFSARENEVKTLRFSTVTE